MTTSSALSIVRDLRPQTYGATAPGRIDNPVVEPLWTGIRVLAAADGDDTLLVDETGEPVTDRGLIEGRFRAAVAADAVIVDGFLTKQAAHDGTGIYVGADPLPPTGKLIARSMIGTRHNRTAEAAEHMEREHEAKVIAPDEPVTFVAIDLLHLDGESLLDVPLLERKRLLESVMGESDLVRRSAYIRPPIDTWLNSWRSLGFYGITYKAANGRYRPGGVKEDWVSAPMPRR